MFSNILTYIKYIKQSLQAPFIKQELYIRISLAIINRVTLIIIGHVCSEFETIRNGQLQSSDLNSDGFYENNMDCTWVIWSNDIENRVIQLYFTSLDIPSRDNCKDDYLQVRLIQKKIINLKELYG